MSHQYLTSNSTVIPFPHLNLSKKRPEIRGKNICLDKGIIPAGKIIVLITMIATEVTHIQLLTNTARNW